MTEKIISIVNHKVFDIVLIIGWFLSITTFAAMMYAATKLAFGDTLAGVVLGIIVGFPAACAMMFVAVKNLKREVKRKRDEFNSLYDTKGGFEWLEDNAEMDEIESPEQFIYYNSEVHPLRKAK